MRFKLEGSPDAKKEDTQAAKRKRIQLDRDDDVTFVKECMDGQYPSPF